MSTFEQARSHVKLAVDLIMLLEQNDIPPQQALDALVIVHRDCKRKVDEQNAVLADTVMG
ncbi:MAG: hypothetical protein ACI9FJ_003108 [Alteromonadaceae bacterium]|jgi:hypothetical protein